MRSGGGSGGSLRGGFRAAREKCGVASEVGTETGVPPREDSRAETDKINNE